MSTATLDPRMRNVLEAPRGRRFSPGAAARGRAARQSADPWFTPRGLAMLTEMRGNPRVEYRLQHGPLPAWMRVEEAMQARQVREPARRAPREITRLERGRHRRRSRAAWWATGLCGVAFLLGVVVGQVATGVL